VRERESLHFSFKFNIKIILILYFYIQIIAIDYIHELEKEKDKHEQDLGKCYLVSFFFDYIFKIIKNFLLKFSYRFIKKRNNGIENNEIKLRRNITLSSQHAKR
jgi:hypothetical protein